MRKTGRLVLISGASRSGKSTYAEKLAAKKGTKIAYLATAQALDEEMKVRIEQHKQIRPKNWQTFEEPLNIFEVIEKNQRIYDTWLFECITLYISNLMFSQAHTADVGDNFISAELQNYVLHKIDTLIQTVKTSPITMIAVTNEVGWGIVPADALSRAYSDIVGKANQKLASAAEEVYLVALGIPVRLKPQNIAVEQQKELD